MPELSTGTKINNRYTLLEHKGSGSFGEVWMAHDEILDSNVAVKVYISLDPRGIDEFKAEYNMAVGLSHPNLLTANYLDVWEQRPYLVMKYCSRGSSSKLAGNADEATIIRFIHDVAAGLHYLHELPDPIIHQDIKPDNILVDEDGQFLITDFGISKKLRSTMRKQSSRSVGAGATAYMGPERFESHPSPVKASDIWSLGASIYELATGELPFSGLGGGMQRNGAEMPVLDEKWSKELNLLMQSCLAQETWDRPTAAQLEAYTQTLMEGGTPEPTWHVVASNSAASEHEEADATAGTSSQSEQEAQSVPDEESRDILKNLKILIWGSALFYPILSVILNFFTEASIIRYIVGLVCNVLLICLAYSSTHAISHRKSNAIFKTKSYFIITFIYWFFFLEVTYIPGIWIIFFLWFVSCLRQSNTKYVKQLFPKESRHHSFTDVVNNCLIVVFFVMLHLGIAGSESAPVPQEPAPAPVQQASKPKAKTKPKPQTKVKTESVTPEMKDEVIKEETEKPEMEEMIIYPSSDTDDSQAQRLQSALSRKDYKQVQKLANQGYAPAYVPLAKFYLQNNDYADADRYAKKAKNAGQAGANDVIKTLKNLGYYD